MIGGVTMLRSPSLGKWFSQPLTPLLPVTLATLQRSFDIVHLHMPNPLAECRRRCFRPRASDRRHLSRGHHPSECAVAALAPREGHPRAVPPHRRSHRVPRSLLGRPRAPRRQVRRRSLRDLAAAISSSDDGAARGRRRSAPDTAIRALRGPARALQGGRDARRGMRDVDAQLVVVGDGPLREGPAEAAICSTRARGARSRSSVRRRRRRPQRVPRSVRRARAAVGVAFRELRDDPARGDAVREAARDVAAPVRRRGCERRTARPAA